MSDYSFLIKDDMKGEGKWYDKPYAERYAEWQAIEDAKPLETLLDECRDRAYYAVDDVMVGMRNNPRGILEKELARGVALQGLIHCQSKPNLVDEQTYRHMLAELEPVQGPSRTMDDYLQEGVDTTMQAIDKIILGRIKGE